MGMEIKRNHLPKATVKISGWSSTCLACGHDALPQEGAHITRVGWDPGDRKGCGIEWTHVTAEYSGESFENTVKEMCPDLEFIREYEVTIDESDSVHYADDSEPED
jgi:hypothetical protein